MDTNYNNCNEEIAECLMCGEHVKCNVVNPADGVLAGRKALVKVVAYITIEDADMQFYLDSAGKGWEEATPVKKEQRVIDHVAMMEGLLSRGYLQHKNGDWHDKGRTIDRGVFYYCGKLMDHQLTFADWMLEEVEV